MEVALVSVDTRILLKTVQLKRISIMVFIVLELMKIQS